MLRNNRLALLRALVVVILATSTHAVASVPDWLRQAAQTSIPIAHLDSEAVLLLDHRITTVSSNGEIRTIHRKAYKILRPKGQHLGNVVVAFDSDTRLTYLKGWSITAGSTEYEVKEKDAIETSLSSYALYEDTRRKILQIPAAIPGSVIGYEYQQKEHSSVFQTVWDFQDEIPVMRARFDLELPQNWSYTTYWFNYAESKPQPTGSNRWTWELTDVPALESEPHMPVWRALAGHLGISLVPPSANGASPGDWPGIGRWYGQLTNGRREVTPLIADKVRELTAGKANVRDKLIAITSYVQHQIRYVAIEIGIGGYQPHIANEILGNAYGDCKDKATLLSAMLKAIGVDSYYVAINTDRGFTAPKFPTMRSFNHVILAIRLPTELPRDSFNAVLEKEGLGTLLFFDPTDNMAPLGYLPPYLQANHGLLVTEQGGELITLPLLPPSTNRLLRTAKLKIDELGNIEGTIEEYRTGPIADTLREQFLAAPKAKRQVVFERLLSSLLGDAVLSSASISGLNEPENSLALTYSFKANGYAQRAGELFLFRPCALGRRAIDVMEGKPRKLPVEFEYAMSQNDIIDISFPPGLKPEEFPKSMKLDYPFVTYTSDVKVGEDSVRYTRNIVMLETTIPVDQLDQLKQYFRQVSQDERSYAILKGTFVKPSKPADSSAGK